MKSSILFLLIFAISSSFGGAVSDTASSSNPAQLLPVTNTETVQLEAGVGSPQSQSYWEDKLIQFLKAHTQQDDVENVDINVLITALKKALLHLIQRHSSSPSGVNGSEARPQHHHHHPDVPNELSSLENKSPPLPPNNLRLLAAIKSDNLEAVGRQVRCGDFANVVDSDGYAMIHHATSSNGSKVLKYLVEVAGANVNSTSQPGQDTPLHLAVRNNYKSIVKYLVEKGADVNAQNSLGISPMHLAVDGGNDTSAIRTRVSRSTQANLSEGSENFILGAVVRRCDKFQIAQYLVENGANINAKSNAGDTPLHFAVRAGCNMQVVEYLVEHGAVVGTPNKEGRTPLDLSESGDDVFQYLIQRVGSTSTTPPATTTVRHTDMSTTTARYGNLTLVDAIIRGDVQAVRYHVGVGDNTTELTRNGHTATHIAAASDSRLQVLQYLVEEAGLPVDITNIYGHTPLHVAAFYAQLENMKYLHKKGAHVAATSNFGGTPLHRAAISRNLESVKFLVDNGADVRATDDDADSVLHWASLANHMPTVKFLVENGADRLNLKNRDGSTSLHYACLRNEQEDGNIEVVKYLVEKGADVKARDNNGITPLHLAAQRYRFRTIEFLITNGADVNAKDDEGNSPLHLMAGNSYMFHEGSMTMLVENGADLRARNKANETAYISSHMATPADEYLYDPVVVMIPGKKGY